MWELPAYPLAWQGPGLPSEGRGCLSLEWSDEKDRSRKGQLTFPVQNKQHEHCLGSTEKQ